MPLINATAIEHAPWMVLVIDHELQIVRANFRAERVFGASAGTLVGQSLCSVLPQPDNAAVYELIANSSESETHAHWVAIEDGRAVSCRFKHRDGRLFEGSLRIIRTWLHGQSTSVLYFEELPESIWGRILGDSNQFVEYLLQVARIGAWDWNLSDQTVRISSRWKQQLGYSPDEIGDSPFDWARLVHRDDQPRFVAELEQYARERSGSFRSEFRVIDRNGLPRWILIQGDPLIDHSGDCSHLAGMYADITLFKELERRQLEINIEFEAARQLQQSLLRETSPVPPWLEYAADVRPAHFASGDFYQCVQLMNGTFGMLICDVSGHGLPAALFMTSLHSHFESLASHCVTPSELMYRCNDYAARHSTNGRFATSILIQFSPDHRSFVYINAGHAPFGYLLNSHGEIKHVMEPSTCPLGVEPDTPFGQSKRVAAESGDVIVLFSDGLTEAVRPDGNMLGEADVLHLIQQQMHLPVGQAVTAVLDRVHATSVVTDDTTLILARIV